MFVRAQHAARYNSTPPFPLIDFSLYFVTDRQQTGGRPLIDVVHAALDGGVRAIQLREKDLSTRELEDWLTLFGALRA